jgi:hypothetical protein
MTTPRLLNILKRGNGVEHDGKVGTLRRQMQMLHIFLAASDVFSPLFFYSFSIDMRERLTW